MSREAPLPQWGAVPYDPVARKLYAAQAESFLLAQAARLRTTRERVLELIRGGFTALDGRAPIAGRVLGDAR
jgi:hypothetical protein